ncbi:DoxX family protein [Streptomyces sp. V4I8]|uniref:DoxX family protein n=1 Tax=Streptomyces sp. V4I8 TaxID=3156469 RepID=UPI003518853B
MDQNTHDLLRSQQVAYDGGLFLIRLAVGLPMAGHGAQKLFGWFDGSGIDKTGEFFTSSGYQAGKAMAVVAGLSELIGGLGLALGLVTPLAGAAIVGVMLNVLAVKWGSGYFMNDKDGGLEYELLILASAAALTLTGPGRVSCDAHLPILRDCRLFHAAMALGLGVVTAGVILLIRD